jgi:hypothetical protein
MGDPSLVIPNRRHSAPPATPTSKLHPRISLLSTRPATSNRPSPPMTPISSVAKKEQDQTFARSMILINPSPSRPYLQRIVLTPHQHLHPGRTGKHNPPQPNKPAIKFRHPIFRMDSLHPQPFPQKACNSSRVISLRLPFIPPVSMTTVCLQRQRIFLGEIQQRKGHPDQQRLLPLPPPDAAGAVCKRIILI